MEDQIRSNIAASTFEKYSFVTGWFMTWLSCLVTYCNTIVAKLLGATKHFEHKTQKSFIAPGIPNITALPISKQHIVQIIATLNFIYTKTLQHLFETPGMSELNQDPRAELTICVRCSCFIN